MTTKLRAVVYFVDTFHYSWRLETANGNHATIVDSGTAYLTRASAQAGLARFLARYIRPDALIEKAVDSYF